MDRIAGLVTALFLATGCAVDARLPAPLASYRVLNDELVQRVVPGQNRDDVLALLGPPVQTMSFARLGHTAWDYRYVDTWGYHAIFSVTFDARGIVVSRITQRIERERR